MAGLSRIILIVGVVALSASCSKHEEPKPSSQAEARPAWKWSAGPEQSFIHSSGYDGVISMLTRCWKIDQGYDCVMVIDENRLITDRVYEGPNLEIRRVYLSHLPFDYLDKNINDPEYSCQYRENKYDEIITAGPNQISHNSVDIYSPFPGVFWSQRQKEDVVQTPAGRATLFNCQRLGQVLGKGGAVTLGTSLVRHSDL